MIHFGNKVFMSRRLTKQEFVDRCNKIHVGIFDYTFSEYINNSTKVDIICRKHGIFKQTPTNHFAGQGCPSCGGTKKLNTTEFIKKAKNVHNNQYDYSESNYITAHIDVKIICNEHGVFNQTPANHLSGKGCPSCVGLKRLNKELFIEKAKKTHGENYKYSKVVYKGNKIKVLILCDIHGDFNQTPDSHMRGVGCPSCAEYGFDRNKKGWLYILRSDCGRYMKIGITHDPKQRHIKLKHQTPFSFRCIELTEGMGEQMAALEKELLAQYQPVEFESQFDGYSEWRLWDESIRTKLLTSKIQG